jgi:hypothetical protein
VARRRDGDEQKRRQWTSSPALWSGCVGAREQNRAGQGASVGGGGADRALALACGLVEAADDGGRGLRRRSGESSRVEERRRQQRAREGVEEVEKCPGACFKTRRGHGER